MLNIVMFYKKEIMKWKFSFQNYSTQISYISDNKCVEIDKKIDTRLCMSKKEGAQQNRFVAVYSKKIKVY
jgi:hypothetical protein